MHILCLEDDGLVARSVGRLLSVRGHAFTHVTDGAAAIEALENGGVDAIIADLGLNRGESGEDVLDWVAEHRPNIVRILTSGGPKPTSFNVEPPMAVFLPKPFEPGEIDRILRAAEQD